MLWFALMISKKNKLPDLTSDLFNLLYGTDYKSELMDLDVIPEHTAFSTQNLNYQVSAERITLMVY